MADAEPVADAGSRYDTPAGPEADDEVPGRRAISLRLARLHLRMGLLALARAELEAVAGRGSLDELALLDLAEARWRTGDLAGAGEAANAALGRGAGDPLAYVIAAEAIAGVGRPAEARRLAARALEAEGLSLDEVFAGMPRSLIWPGDPPVEDGAAPPAGHRTRASTTTSHPRPPPRQSPSPADAPRSRRGTSRWRPCVSAWPSGWSRSSRRAC